MRSYALTLSAVSLRFFAYLFDLLNVNLGPRETYIILAYSSWMVNLIIVEVIIYYRVTKGDYAIKQG